MFAHYDSKILFGKIFTFKNIYPAMQSKVLNDCEYQILLKKQPRLRVLSFLWVKLKEQI